MTRVTSQSKVQLEKLVETWLLSLGLRSLPFRFSDQKFCMYFRFLPYWLHASTNSPWFIMLIIFNV